MIVKRFAPVLGLGATFGILHSTFYMLGNRIDSFKNEEDEFERKEIVRRTKRLAVEDTIAEIGEGRGMLLFS